MSTSAATSRPEPRPTIVTVPLGSWQTNCHLVCVPGPDGATAGRPCWIVDCGERPQPLFAEIDRRGLKPSALYLSHCHVDHIAGIDQALSRYGPLPIRCHPIEAAWNAEPTLNLSAFVGMEVRVTPPTDFVEDGQRIELDGTTWEVLHVPGHSPGSVAYVHRPSGQALVGDTLFAGSIGRFDFPTSDGQALKRSIFEVLLRLPDTMEIRPGHGPTTTIGAERRSNPYVRSPSGW